MSLMKIEVACICGQFFAASNPGKWPEVAERMVQHATEKHSDANGAQFEVEMWEPES